MNDRPNGSPMPEPDRLLADFFAAEAPPYEPPVLLPAVLARTALTRRRPAWRIPSRWLPADRAWRPRDPRRSTMFDLFRLSAAGAILALVGGGLLASLAGSPSPGVPPSPSPAPIAAVDGDAPLTPGATYFYDGAWFEGSPRYLFTVPGTDWSTRSALNFGKYLAAADGGEILVTPWKPDNLFNDPCKYLTGGQVDPPVGPSVDDLVSALITQAAGNASTPSDVTVGGYVGMRLELSLPDGLDIGSCEGGQYLRWTEEGHQGGHVYLDGQRDILYILDLDGLRAVIAVIYQEGTTEADLAEVDDLIDSVRFEWPSPSPSPASASPVATVGG